MRSKVNKAMHEGKKMVFSLEDNEIDLLRFNYERLHDAILRNHEFSWTVSSIFIPLVFTLQGFVFEYFKPLSNPNYQTAIYALIIESMVIIWWLIMIMFRVYNRARIFRLRKIESILNNMGNLKNLLRVNIRPIEQYNLDYNLKLGNMNFEFFHIYNLFLTIISIINFIIIFSVEKDSDKIVPDFPDPILIIFLIALILIVFVKREEMLDEKRKIDEYKSDIKIFESFVKNN